jgi:hypothetical protein
MSETLPLIERMARAIFEDLTNQPWDTAPRALQERARVTARLALQAARTPTPAMYRAKSNHYWACDAWMAMVDVALEENQHVEGD